MPGNTNLTHVFQVFSDTSCAGKNDPRGTARVKHGAEDCSGNRDFSSSIESDFSNEQVFAWIVSQHSKIFDTSRRLSARFTLHSCTISGRLYAEWKNLSLLVVPKSSQGSRK